jgi:hypothetical protein
MDGEEFQVAEALYNELSSAGAIYYCDECSSTFNGSLVAHPNVGKRLTVIRTINAAIAAQETNR